MTLTKLLFLLLLSHVHIRAVAVSAFQSYSSLPAGIGLKEGFALRKIFIVCDPILVFSSHNKIFIVIELVKHDLLDLKYKLCY